MALLIEQYWSNFIFNFRQARGECQVEKKAGTTTKTTTCQSFQEATGQFFNRCLCHCSQLSWFYFYIVYSLSYSFSLFFVEEGEELAQVAISNLN